MPNDTRIFPAVQLFAELVIVGLLIGVAFKAGQDLDNDLAGISLIGAVGWAVALSKVIASPAGLILTGADFSLARSASTALARAAPMSWSMRALRSSLPLVSNGRSSGLTGSIVGLAPGAGSTSSGLISGASGWRLTSSGNQAARM